MKTFLTATIACLMLATLVTAQDAATADSAPNELVRHVVLFEFKEDATPENIQKVETAFAALADKIDEVTDLEWGTNSSPEGLSQGFTHCFLLTFDSEADRDTYLTHAEHQEFVELLRPHLEEALVVDYTPRGK